MAREKREVVLARELRAWELRQARKTHAEIATELGLERSAVTKILARLHARYAHSLLTEIAAVQGEQLIDLAFIRDEALSAWERSKTPLRRVKRVRKTLLTKDGTPVPVTELTREREERVGEAEYLGKAMDALAAIRKITGAEARDISDDALNDAIERELARLAGQGSPTPAPQAAPDAGGES